MIGLVLVVEVTHAGDQGVMALARRLGDRLFLRLEAGLGFAARRLDLVAAVFRRLDEHVHDVSLLRFEAHRRQFAYALRIWGQAVPGKSIDWLCQARPGIESSDPESSRFALQHQLVGFGVESTPLHGALVASGVERVAVEVERVPLGDQRVALGDQRVALRVELVVSGVELIPLEHQLFGLRMELVALGQQLVALGVQSISLAGK